MATRRPRIQDVARKAGVVPSTVSRVLNDYPDVSAETRAKVERAIESLGFRPSQAARAFRGGRTHSVSIMLPMPGTEFYARLLTGIESVLDEHAYSAGLFPLLTLPGLERYRDADALPYRADGLLLASLDPERVFQGGRPPVALPLVLVDSRHPAFDWIALDNAAGGRLAAQVLNERPAETFVILIRERFDTPFASGVFNERLQGFKAALAEGHGRLDDDHVVTVEFSASGGGLATRHILEVARGPVNIFATCDLVARGVLEEGLRGGKTPGSDLRVVGFDGEEWTEGAGLTTIEQPIEEMGRAAARALLVRLADETLPPRHTLLEPRLIRRSSA